MKMQWISSDVTDLNCHCRVCCTSRSMRLLADFPCHSPGSDKLQASQLLMWAVRCLVCVCPFAACNFFFSSEGKHICSHEELLVWNWTSETPPDSDYGRTFSSNCTSGSKLSIHSGPRTIEQLCCRHVHQGNAVCFMVISKYAAILHSQWLHAHCLQRSPEPICLWVGERWRSWVMSRLREDGLCGSSVANISLPGLDLLIRLIPAKSLVQVRVDVIGQQSLARGKGTNVPLSQGGPYGPWDTAHTILAQLHWHWEGALDWAISLSFSVWPDLTM